MPLQIFTPQNLKSKVQEMKSTHTEEYSEAEMLVMYCDMLNVMAENYMHEFQENIKQCWTDAGEKVTENEH